MTNTPDPPRARHRVRVERRADASMGLFRDIAGLALDPGYAEASSRREAPVPPRTRALRAGSNLLLAMLLGVGSATAVSALRAPQRDVDSPRAVLEREITQRSARAEDLSGDNEALSAEIAQIQADALAAANPGLLAELQEAELLSGAVAVEGPGLVIELDDAAGAADDDASRVQDVDLQIVTNGLWSAGAEAIAVNGQRLMSLSAIRGAGQAILVDLTPLLPPYRVEAIGDPDGIQAGFARSTAANHLAFLSGTYGIEVRTTVRRSLTLPGSGNVTLRYASQPTPSATPEEGPS